MLGEIENRFNRRVWIVPVTRRCEVTGHPRTRLDEDTNPDATRSCLKAGIPNGVHDGFRMYSSRCWSNDISGATWSHPLTTKLHI